MEPKAFPKTHDLIWFDLIWFDLKYNFVGLDVTGKTKFFKVHATKKLMIINFSGF